MTFWLNILRSKRETYKDESFTERSCIYKMSEANFHFMQILKAQIFLILYMPRQDWFEMIHTCNIFWDAWWHNLQFLIASPCKMLTLSCWRLVAVFQSLSSRIRVHRGKRMDMPSAVCISDLENSAPVISHTGAFCKHEQTGYILPQLYTQYELLQFQLSTNILNIWVLYGLFNTFIWVKEITSQ